MADPNLLAVLAYGHVLSAMVWLGGGILTGFFIGPSLRKLSPPSALEFNAKVLPKILVLFQVAILTTVAFGLLLLYVFKDGDLSFLMNSTQGYVLSTGILIAAIAAAVGGSVALPSFRKVVKLSAEALASGKPPSQDLMKYGNRARVSSTATLLMLFLVLAMMVVSGFLF